MDGVPQRSPATQGGRAPTKTLRIPKEANYAIASKSLNRSLSAANVAKQDDFYTQYVDIQKEVEANQEYDPNTFRDKVLYYN